jgi:hypothetical protein
MKKHKLIIIDLANFTVVDKIRGLHPPKVGHLPAVLCVWDSISPGREKPEQIVTPTKTNPQGAKKEL